MGVDSIYERHRGLREESREYDSVREGRMSELTRVGTAEPVPGDQILRRERGQGKITFPVQPTMSRISSHTRLFYTLLKVLTIHAYYYINDDW